MLDKNYYWNSLDNAATTARFATTDEQVKQNYIINIYNLKNPRLKISITAGLPPRNRNPSLPHAA